MGRHALIFAVILACASLEGSAEAQDAVSVQTVKELYAAAAYEDALAAVKKLHSERPVLEIEQYRAFSLFALGRSDEAHSAIERLMSVDPLYLPDPAETSPRVREAFTQARQRILPEVSKRMYVEAKAALERKDRGAAVLGFEKLLQIIDSAAPPTESLRELRLLASGFLDLSRGIPDTPVRTEVAPFVAAAAPHKPLPAETSAALPRPIAIKQDLPPWMPVDPISQQRHFDGAVKVRVGVNGRVESAEMVREVHPAYDASLLRATANWVYEPARANGVAIPSELIIQIQLRPPR